MEVNPDIDDADWAESWQWQSLEDTIVLVGLLLFQASLFKSGYPREVTTELQIRLAEMIKRYSKKGV